MQDGCARPKAVVHTDCGILPQRRINVNDQPVERPVLSVVVPVYNEEESLEAFYEAVSCQLEQTGYRWELIFVNDGSRDHSLKILRTIHERDPRVHIVDFAKNFGNQIALSAGFEYASGDAVMIMDADLQHPPELIPEMIRLWKEENYLDVYTVRTYGKNTGRFKRGTSRLFHKILNKLSDLHLPEGISDFRLLDRKVVDYLNEMKESSRFLRAQISWLGFRQIGIPYTAPPRIAGRSKFSIHKLIQLSLDGMTGFSIKPLRAIVYFGMFTALISGLYACSIVYETLFYGQGVPGWPTLIVAILFMGGVQLISLGVIGEYVGKIYLETKQRPLYTVQETIGFSRERGPDLQIIPVEQEKNKSA